MIGILADTHDNLDMVRRAVRLFNDMGCGLVVYAGDFVILLINPGEAGGWLRGKSTMALFDPNSMSVDIVPLS